MPDITGMTISPPMFRYWGKADPSYAGEPKWHPWLKCDCDGESAIGHEEREWIKRQ
jgi:hypothetical protein